MSAIIRKGGVTRYNFRNWKHWLSEVRALLTPKALPNTPNDRTLDFFIQSGSVTGTGKR